MQPKNSAFESMTHLKFAYSKSIIETLEKGVKCV